uniref:Brinker DNA-binding domain-containing protein n=1 Tax=Chelonoidis abingdonii TaxID=106734 RepID=A0A8C0J9M6_CHEAB
VGSKRLTFKLKVVDYAEANNNCAATREFCINEKQVREWRKNKTTLKDMPRSKKKTGIHLHELQMLKDDKYKSVKPLMFIASAGWCTRFMSRHGFCLRQRTKIAQKLPRDLELKIESFQSFIIKYRKEYAFERSQIRSMDETLMTFDFLSNRMVTGDGEKTVLTKTTGHEKIHFMVVLSCLADGSKLPPVVVFLKEKPCLRT